MRDRLEGASTPLTPRERDIAVMASKGMTSPVIATALMLSVRTVDNTLSRVYREIGVTSRAQLQRTGPAW